MLVQLDSRSVDHVKNILGWVAFARRPLRKLEFLSALSYSSGNPDVTNLAPRYILDICGSLVEERQDTTLAFIHISVKEFLQTPSSNVVIHEQEALQEHAVATIACLLSGVRVFSNAYPEQAKYQRVAKGLHGLHVYATEYWTECLLSHAASGDGLDQSSSLFVLASQLVHELDKAYGQPGAPNAGSNIRISDKRLALLQQHGLLHKHVEGALKGRSLKRLESELLQVPPPDKNSQQLPNSPFIEPISAMLVSYQDIVRALLGKQTYPGVSAEELELFKTHFRTSAYTCRLNSCFRATLGFESAKKCLEHEKSHVQCLRCTFPGCQYPPFISPQALRSHTNKYHNPNPPRKAIRSPRRVRQINSSPGRIETLSRWPQVDDSADPTHTRRLFKAQDGRLPVGNGLSSVDPIDSSHTSDNPQPIPHFQLPSVDYGHSFDDLSLIPDDGLSFVDPSLIPDNIQPIPHFQLPPPKNPDGPWVDMQSVSSPAYSIPRLPNQANFSAPVSNRPISPLSAFDDFMSFFNASQQIQEPRLPQIIIPTRDPSPPPAPRQLYVKPVEQDLTSMFATRHSTTPVPTREGKLQINSTAAAAAATAFGTKVDFMHQQQETDVL